MRIEANPVVNAWGKLNEATSWGSDLAPALSKVRGIDLDEPWRLRASHLPQLPEGG